MPLQKTTKAPFELEGACLWSEKVSRVRVSPADPDTGIVLRRIDGGRQVIFPVSVENAEVESHCVVLSSNGSKLMFVEHLLAALWGMGIDNAHVEVKGAELPFLDGSALPYVKEIRRVGTLTQIRNRRSFRPHHSLCMLNKGRCMYLAPASDFSISYIFWHNSLRICRFPSIEHEFATRIAPARTFAAGPYPSFPYPFRIRHSGKLSFPYPARFADEMLRHKVLDIIGDFALLGVRVKAHVWAYGTGHSDTHKAIKLSLKEEKRWKTSV
jgi:UDP-3-O-acyl-N-acetylglucosamine deacetylase